MTATILRADAARLPLPDASVDLIVTSPPYWSLRSYTDGGDAYAGQIGAEPTWQEYIDNLIRCTREWVRVLKPTGSLFVNLGDKYSTGNSGQSGMAALGERYAGGGHSDAKAKLPPKSLMDLPWRYSIRCVDELGLIKRAEILWSKPNGLPESVTDRVRRSHEVFLHLTKLPRYFSAVDEIREGHVRQPRPNERLQLPGGGMAGQRNIPGRSDYGQPGSKPSEWNPLGKLPGSVWEIPDGVDGSLVRLVLAAVSAGELSIEEGERLLWDGSRSSGRRSTSATVAAGSGSASSTAKATAATGAPTSATAAHTDSRTSSSRARSPMRSPSTTSAAGDPASTLTTSSPSLSPSTSSADQAPSPSASTGMPSLLRTPTFAPTGTESADSACDCGCANTDDASELPDSTVWTIATEPLKVPAELGVDHFAAFPTEWPRRLVQGWSPSGICTACGEGRRPVVRESRLTAEGERIAAERGPASVEYSAAVQTGAPGASFGKRRALSGTELRKYSEPTAIVGEACACPDTTAPTRPAAVLDPFGGTGTTALVASVLGRHGISVDMSGDYSRLARWRTQDPGQRAKAARVTAPPKQLDGQADLFGEWAS